METAMAKALVRKFYEMMDERKLPKTEIIEGIQLYRANLMQIGFKLSDHHHKYGSEVIQLTKMLDEEVTTTLCAHKSPAEFEKWLDLWKQ